MSDSTTSLYKTALMDHFKNPRNKQQGPFPASALTARGSNPRCGDDIEVGLEFEHRHEHTHVAQAGFRGRGCSVCLASASMMTEAVADLSTDESLALADLMQSWVDNQLDNASEIPSILQPLGAVKDHPARKKCVMLAWQALKEVISKLKGDAA